MRALNKLILFILASGLMTPVAAATEKAGEDWTLIFSDDFTGKKLDPKKWAIVHSNGCPSLCGFGNKELQAYNKKNVQLKDGMLVITAEKRKGMKRTFQSGKVTLKPTGGYTYGKLSVRAKLPKGIGTWPAIWMLPVKDVYGPWPKSGEIDVMEHVGFDQDVIHGTIHTEAFNHKIGTQKGKQVKLYGASEEFHTYSLTWTKTRLIWDIDGTVYYTIDKNPSDGSAEWPFDTPYYLILNVAVGGMWGGKEGVAPDHFPTKMVVDWVKIWQKQ